MAYRKKPKKLTKKQKKQRTQFGIMGLIILFSFTIGLTLGRSENPDYSINERILQFKEEVTAFFQEEMGWSNEKKELKEQEVQAGQFRFLDVGQGSATLIQSEDGTNILIDTGRYEDKDKKILSYLDQYIGTGGKIDLLIFTHNDSDHIGYGDLILQYYNVQEVWMNGYDSTSKIYERILDALAQSNAQYAEPKSGENHQIGPFLLEVLNPTVDPRSNPNDDSIVIKMTMGDFSAMLSGDASSRVEEAIIDSGAELKSTLLLMGHHGSKESSSDEWIEAIQPGFSIYSAGLTNSYGHPNKETIERFELHEIPIYGTAEDGTVTVRVNPNGNYSIDTEKGEH
ncbi:MULTISPECIES: ComEC/Rec2 family competence protein [Carnobacterium]|uniref:ComEC/Rec2 family competence protein n=1 Tax=Carnobacterium antarcticum TaxID=2126436 RepID=A0ABW4NMY6_9LACT|nr:MULTISPECIES: ComEC/Rec2 family competence protein [unclassified Carnobacterium]ALV20680.1 Late competence protein ComEC, DNA transport [Carnobacterium sp. CP1]QQP70916.1 MBL fold metallo-hydrolase [Carnobacterium sp. CS13]